VFHGCERFDWMNLTKICRMDQSNPMPEMKIEKVANCGIRDSGGFYTFVKNLL
jgi:hypothetical protein